MVVISFYLLGNDPAISENVHLIEIDITHDLDAAQVHVADSFSVTEPKRVGFQTKDAQSIPDLDVLLDAEQPIAVTIDGHAIRQVPGPDGLPFVGSYYQIYPDHIGNNQRLFNRLGSVIKHTDMGRTWYLTNDPAVASQMFQENAFWSKLITKDHPLSSAKDNRVGLFLADTDTDTWRLAHKFLAPSLAPKAVRKYTPMTQRAAEETFPIFDQFADQNEAFDVFTHMFKLASQAVAKLALNVDLHHFDSADAPLAGIVSDLNHVLEMIKKNSEKPSCIIKAMEAAQARGGPDLPITTAAIEAESIADFVARAIDEDGNKFPSDVAVGAFLIIIGAGFATTSSLLSWMIYASANHAGVQDKLLQELIDHDTTADTQWDYDNTSELHYLDKYIKETQRLYNPAFQPERTALRDQIMPGGYEIPKGTTMICSLHALHRNPAVWDDPGAFDPDRWDTEKVRKRPAGSFVPFATGPRSCIGFNFALQEAKTMFSTLLYRYEFVKYGEKAVDYDKEVIIFRPQGLYYQVRRRTHWPQKSQERDCTPFCECCCSCRRAYKVVRRLIEP